MTLAELNMLPRYRAEEEFIKCCGSTGWARAMARRRPFASFDRLLKAATEIWWRLDASDWMEAFRAHPRIGERRAPTSWSAQEQSGMSRAGPSVASAIEEANHEYFAKFGFIFIICATGKSAQQMLENVRSRLANAPEAEVRVAAEEQNKIAHLRLRKLIAP
jgi:OHCU decarboxylase